MKFLLAVVVVVLSSVAVEAGNCPNGICPSGPGRSYSRRIHVSSGYRGHARAYRSRSYSSVGVAGPGVVVEQRGGLRGILFGRRTRSY